MCVIEVIIVSGIIKFINSKKQNKVEATINNQVNVTETSTQNNSKVKSIATAPFRMLKTATVGTLGAAHFVLVTAAHGCEKLECVVEGDKTPEQKSKRRNDRMKSTLNKQDAITYLMKKGKDKAEEQVVVVKTAVAGVRINPNAVKQSVIDVKNRAANAIHKEIHRFDTPKKEIVVESVKAEAPDQSKMKLPVLTGTAPIAKEVEPAPVVQKPTKVTTPKKTTPRKPKATKVKPVTLEQAFDKGVTNEEFSKLD